VSTPSIASRVVRATVIVAVFSALALAVVAAVTAAILWQSSERRFLADTASGVQRAIDREALEESSTLEEAAPEALKDLEIAGCQVEVWKGATLIAMKPRGRPLGPPGASSASDPPGWLLHVQDLDGGGHLIVAQPREQTLRSLRMFGLSLLLSLPVCLFMALLAGRYAAQRATRPLAEFTDRIRQIEGLHEAEPQKLTDPPREVLEMDVSFRELLGRLSRSVARELEFAANASHELRTPLTRIRLYAERALSGASEASRSDLDEQIREIDRMVRLVDSLLILARDTELRLPHGEDVNLADVLRDVARQTLRQETRASLEGPDEAIVRGDEDLLRIAVENLLDNARKFTPPDRTIAISVSEAENRVRVAVVQPGVLLADREHIFERFFRGEDARAARPGHGLGLSIARHIAQLHGGDVVCDCTDAGVTFVLSLPAWQPRRL